MDSKNIKDYLHYIETIPKPEPKFKKSDLVKTPIGEMIVIGVYSHELLKGKWVPKYQLAFISRTGRINKKRNHRLFTEDVCSRVFEPNP